MTNKYGLYGTLQAQAGKGHELSEILLHAAKLMENAQGCILYIVNTTPDKPDQIHIVEVWESEDDHDRSLQLPGVRELISEAIPILDGKPEGITLNVLGGKGLG